MKILMLSNTDKFLESALHFKEYDKYTSEYPGSSLWKKFWEQEKDRCLHGYHAGHDKIPGYFYWYLNYVPIYKVSYKESTSSGQIRGERLEGFPDFWDGDYNYFWYLEEAEEAGEHGIVVKTRGRGYSFKGGGMLTRNYYHIPGSKSYAIASQSEFLTKDGILTKAWDNMDFVDNNTPWGKRREKKDSEFHRRASYLQNVNGIWIEKGYKSEIIGLTVGDNPNKVRGKRGKLILFEEGGEFPNLLKVWQIMQKSVQQDKVTYGLMAGFGTGGSAEGAAGGLEELFYKPKAYNIHAVPNTYDIDREGSKCGLFIPVHMNRAGFMDKDGNSDLAGAYADVISGRKILMDTSADAEAVLRETAESPTTPQEAFQRVSNNFFQIVQLRSWLNELSSDDVYKNIGTHVKLKRAEDNEVYTVLDDNAKPLNRYPTPKGIKTDGAVTIYFRPHKIDGKVPKNTYYSVADPYGLTTKGGKSLGVIYVMAYPSKLIPIDDCIMASYIGRPDDQDTWNETAFMLTEFYNAKLTPENDRGNMVDYARYRKLLNYLQPEFLITSKNGKEYNKLGRGFGVSMSSIEVKLQAIIYFNDWLMKKRTIDYKGKQLYNYHYIYDIALLEELVRHNLSGNFDRVSAMLIHACVRENNVNTILKNAGKSNVSEFKKLFFQEN